jgi:hypothetical protein
MGPESAVGGVGVVVDHDVHEPLEDGAVAWPEGSQDRVLNLERDDVEAMERVATGGGQTERVAASIVRIAPSRDQTGTFENVDDGHDVGRVVRDLIADSFLRDRLEPLDPGQHAVARGAQARFANPWLVRQSLFEQPS